MAVFTVQIKGLDQELAKIRKFPGKLKQDIDQDVRIAADEWVLKAQVDAPKDVGFLTGSIRSDKIEVLKHLVIVGSEYGPFLEFGTKGKYRAIPGTEAFASQFKGRMPGTFKEFLRNIVNWVRRKGISGTYSVKTRKRTGNKAGRVEQDYTVAFLIARSILKNGINPQPYFFKHQETVIGSMVTRIKAKIDSYD